jgi:hypothetical protein
MTVQPVRASRANRYRPLTERLATATADSVTLPVDEIDSLVGGLPATAHRQATWWSNDGAHAQARAWLSAGFRVTAVDTGGAVRFVRSGGRIAALELLRRTGGGTVVVGRLDRHTGVVVADAGAAHLLADDHQAVLPRGVKGRGRVRPAAGEAFLLACWFTLRGTEAWGRLLGWDGQPISREEGIAMIEAYRTAGAWDEDGRVR